MPFLILFILIPLMEIMVFISVSGKIGLGTALLFALFTAVLGGIIVKYQGIQTMITAQGALQRGEIPGKELFDGLCLVAAGATLITPGFITDAIGFALLVPAVRDVLRRKLAKNARFQTMNFHTEYTQSHHGQAGYRSPDPDVIDVEYETIDEQDRT